MIRADNLSNAGALRQPCTGDSHASSQRNRTWNRGQTHRVAGAEGQRDICVTGSGSAAERQCVPVNGSDRGVGSDADTRDWHADIEFGPIRHGDGIATGSRIQAARDGTDSSTNLGATNAGIGKCLGAVRSSRARELVMVWPQNGRHRGTRWNIRARDRHANDHALRASADGRAGAECHSDIGARGSDRAAEGKCIAIDGGDGGVGRNTATRNRHANVEQRSTRIADAECRTASGCANRLGKSTQNAAHSG